MALLGVSYALLAGVHAATLVVPVPMNLQLLLVASLVVYVGAALALQQEVAERLQTSDAVQFPFLAGALLGGLFLAFKYLDAAGINAVLSVYFCGAGVHSVAQLAAPLVAPLLPRRLRDAVLLDRELPLLGHVRLTGCDAVCLVLGAAASGAYVTTKHALLNNLLGVAFAVEGIRRLSLGSYGVGAALLSGLFVYDCVMVFGTPLMVTVATKVEGPIKLLFPRGLPDAITGKTPYSMLGLGDLVVPGVFLAMLLRYDALAALRRGTLSLRGGAPLAVVNGVANPPVADAAQLVSANFPRPYFNVGIVAYTLGLGATVVVMVVWEHAQPALLYLVPAVLLASAATAAVRGEVRSLMVEYTDEAYGVEVLGGAPTEEQGAAVAATAAKEGGDGEVSTADATSASSASPASAASAGGVRKRQRRQG